MQNNHTIKVDRNSSKKPYSTPVFVEYGSISVLTQTMMTGMTSDGGIMGVMIVMMP